MPRLVGFFNQVWNTFLAMSKPNQSNKLNTAEIIERLRASEFHTESQEQLIESVITLIQTKGFSRMKLGVMIIRDLYRSDCALKQINSLFGLKTYGLNCIVFQKGIAYEYHSKEIIHTFEHEAK